MKKNNLGSSDLMVSEICLGSMTFGEQNTEADAHEQLDYALDNGVNLAPTLSKWSLATFSSKCLGSTYTLFS